MLDFHNHLIPGVDDGAETLEESMAGLERMRAQGITHVITTTHFQASLLARPAEFEKAMSPIDEAWAKLDAAVKNEFPDLTVNRGVELALDEPIDKVDDARLRLNGSRFVLVEFPYFTIPPHSANALGRLVAGGVTPIVAHPERYRNLDPGLQLLREWKLAGAYLQLNAGSIVGAYGTPIEARAWQCLELGLGDYLCSDYHSRGQCLVEPARASFKKRMAASQFNLLTSSNGGRLLAGLPPVPVPRVPQKGSLIQRLGAAIRGKRP